MRGYLHLRSAILSARTGDRATSDAHLAEAADCARILEPDTDFYDTAFDPANVSIHSVATAVELGDDATALARNTPLARGRPVNGSKRRRPAGRDSSFGAS